MEPFIFFLIIVLIGIGRIVKMLQEQQGSSRNQPAPWDEGWEQENENTAPWEQPDYVPPSKPAQPDPARSQTPPPVQPQHTFPTPKQRQRAAEASARRRAEPGQLLTKEPAPQQVQQQQRQQTFSEEQLKEKLAHAKVARAEIGTAEADVYQAPAMPELKSADEMMDESLAAAFPAARRMVKALRPGVHRPIYLRVSGRKNLRKAVLMSEILGPPRSFDV